MPADIANKSLKNIMIDDLRTHCKTAERDDPIAPIRELCRMYRLSYVTVQQAINQLEKERYLYKRQGKGTFVSGERRIEEKKEERERATIIFAVDWWDDTHPYVYRRQKGVMDTAERLGLRIQLCQFGKDKGTAELVRQAGEPGVKGIFMSWIKPRLYKQMMERNPDLKIVTTLRSDVQMNNVITIKPNYSACASKAIDVLCDMGAQKIACVSFGDKSVCHVFPMTSPSGAKIKVLTYLNHELEAAARDLKKMLPDGIFFTDDRFAEEIIAQLPEKKIPALKERRIASITNIGEKRLPNGTISFEYDGYTYGSVSISVLRSMIDGLPLDCSEIHLEPRQGEIVSRVVQRKVKE